MLLCTADGGVEHKCETLGSPARSRRTFGSGARRTLCVAPNGSEPTYNWMDLMFCCHLKKVRKELPANRSIENA